MIARMTIAFDHQNIEYNAVVDYDPGGGGSHEIQPDPPEISFVSLTARVDGYEVDVPFDDNEELYDAALEAAGQALPDMP
jgi:hypothetical protein